MLIISDQLSLYKSICSLLVIC